MRNIVCAIALALGLATAADAEPFGVTTSPPAEFKWTWDTLVRTMEQEMLLVLKCLEQSKCTPETSFVVASVKEARAAAKAYGAKALIARPNRAVNLALAPQKDRSQYSRAVWVSGLMALHDGKSDCRSDVLLKLLIYRLLGFPEHDLRAVYVRIPGKEEAHLVAAVRQKDTWYIADSNTHFILSDEQRKRHPRNEMRLVPFHVYSFY